MGSLLGDEGLTQEEQSSAYADQIRQKAEEEKLLNQQYVMGGLEGNLNQAAEWRAKREKEVEELKKQQQQGSGGSWWKTALKLAPLALNVIPGIGTAASLALSAGLGAASGAADGGLKGALTGGALGALPGVGGMATKGIASPMTRALTRAGIGAAGNLALGQGAGGAVGGATQGYLGSRGIDNQNNRADFRRFEQMTPATGGLPQGLPQVPMGDLPLPPQQQQQPGGLGYFGAMPRLNAPQFNPQLQGRR
jgi:hypothetical protein